VSKRGRKGIGYPIGRGWSEVEIQTTSNFRDLNQNSSNLTMPPDYDKKIDFHALVQQDAVFKQLLVANGGQMDFQDPEHVLCVLDSYFPLLRQPKFAHFHVFVIPSSLIVHDSELSIITLLS
jgi:hypothetical protein